jgi:hypothetical protein
MFLFLCSFAGSKSAKYVLIVLYSNIYWRYCIVQLIFSFSCEFSLKQITCIQNSVSWFISC